MGRRGLTKREKQILLALFLLVYLFASPVLVNMLVTSAEGIAREEEYTYSVPENLIHISFGEQNGTTLTWNIFSSDLSSLAYTFDNETYTVEMIADYPNSLTNIAAFKIAYALNLTNIVDENVYKIVLKATYSSVNDVNITRVIFWIGKDTYTVTGANGQSTRWISASTGYKFIDDAGLSNKTIAYTIELQTLESLYFSQMKLLHVEIWATFNAADGDYISIQLILYRKATIINRKTLLDMTLGGLTVFNFVLGVFASEWVSWSQVTGFVTKTTRRIKRARKRAKKKKRRRR